MSRLQLPRRPRQISQALAGVWPPQKLQAAVALLTFLLCAPAAKSTISPLRSRGLKGLLLCGQTQSDPQARTPAACSSPIIADAPAAGQLAKQPVAAEIPAQPPDVQMVWTTPSTGIPVGRRTGSMVVDGPMPSGCPIEVSDPLARGRLLGLASGIAQPTGMFEWLTGAPVTDHHQLRFHLKK